LFHFSRVRVQYTDKHAVFSEKYYIFDYESIFTEQNFIIVKKRIAIFASGSGSNAHMEHFKYSNLVEVTLVLNEVYS